MRSRGTTRRHNTPRHRTFKSVALRVLLAGLVLVALGGAYAGVQLARSEPPPALRAVAGLPSSLTVPGRLPALPWPPEGESAVALTGLGMLGSAGPSRPVPLASLAKVMAAVVVLHDRPLARGQPGPMLTITAGDQATYAAEVAAGDSVAPVRAGERLSELQLLEALLIPSADDVAQVLARWDAGSDAAFVARMNSMAAKLGMRATHYVDENGLSAQTVGTARDQLVLAEAAAANPVLMSIVRQPVLTLPDGTTLTNYDTLLGQDGVVGIKTGSTFASGGCFMFAADGVAGGQRIEVLGVVLGQRSHPLIGAALGASRALIRPALAAVHPATVVPAGTTVAQVVTAWGQPVPVKTTKALTLMTVAGIAVHLTVTLEPTRDLAAAPAGSVGATVTATTGRQTETVTAVTAGRVPGASVRWRLERL
jgi:D-alanyl-D-alanine carboxypeptidase (penicillin-binding protein 5/6)